MEMETPNHETVGKSIDEGQLLFFCLFGMLSILQFLWLLWNISQLTVEPIIQMRRNAWNWLVAVFVRPCKTWCPQKAKFRASVRQENDSTINWMNAQLLDDARANETTLGENSSAHLSSDGGPLPKHVGVSLLKMSAELRTLNKLLEKLVAQSEQRQTCTVAQEDVRTPKMQRRNAAPDENDNDSAPAPQSPKFNSYRVQERAPVNNFTNRLPPEQKTVI